MTSTSESFCKDAHTQRSRRGSTRSEMVAAQKETIFKEDAFTGFPPKNVLSTRSIVLLHLAHRSVLAADPEFGWTLRSHYAETSRMHSGRSLSRRLTTHGCSEL